MNEENNSIGDIFNDAKIKAIKGIAIAIGIIVYLGMIAYSGVHNLTLMTRGVPEDLILWAVMGIISLELTAIGLPLALHYWVHAFTQRIVTFLFYAIDLGIVFINVVLSFAVNSGTPLPAWGANWMLYVVPATPIIVGVGYSLLFVLDPAQRRHQLMEQFRVSTHEAHLNQMIAGARTQEVNALVEEKGRADSEAMVRAILGQKRGSPSLIPPPTEQPKPIDSVDRRYRGIIQRRRPTAMQNGHPVTHPPAPNEPTP